VAIGGLAAGGGTPLLIGRLTGNRWTGRVVGDGYSPIGAARSWSAADGGISPDGKTDRWHAITVNLPPEDVSQGGQLPGPLAELGDRIEVQIRPAPGDRGTEIHARAAPCLLAMTRAGLCAGPRGNPMAAGDGRGHETGPRTDNETHAGRQAAMKVH
jgi:hypothetical protein